MPQKTGFPIAPPPLRTPPFHARPRDAATLMVVDRSGPVPTVLMGRRHPGLAFMPGKFVFPGGRVEASDRFMAAQGRLSAPVDAALRLDVSRPTDGRVRALALAAIRETYEETGFLVGRTATTAALARVPRTWRPFAENGIVPDLGALRLVGRAITPAGQARRFDARFFAVDRTEIADRTEGAGSRNGFVGPDKELVELTWTSLDDARHLDLPAITAIMLDALAHQLAADWGPDVPVPFHRIVRGRPVVTGLGRPPSLDASAGLRD